MVARSGNFCGTGEVKEKIRGENKGKEEKTDASCEILMAKMENLIVTVLSLFCINSPISFLSPSPYFLPLILYIPKIHLHDEARILL